METFLLSLSAVEACDLGTPHDNKFHTELVLRCQRSTELITGGKREENVQK